MRRSRSSSSSLPEMAAPGRRWHDANRTVRWSASDDCGGMGIDMDSDPRATDAIAASSGRLRSPSSGATMRMKLTLPAMRCKTSTVVLPAERMIAMRPASLSDFLVGMRRVVRLFRKSTSNPRNGSTENAVQKVLSGAARQPCEARVRSVRAKASSSSWTDVATRMMSSTYQTS